MVREKPKKAVRLYEDKRADPIHTGETVAQFLKRGGKVKVYQSDILRKSEARRKDVK